MRNFLTKVAQFCGKFLAIVINIRLSRNHQDTFGATFEKGQLFTSDHTDIEIQRQKERRETETKQTFKLKRQTQALTNKHTVITIRAERAPF